MPQSRNHRAALAYAELGWPVFPLKPGTKRPLTRHGFKEATTDTAKIEAWWTAMPMAGVGIATGTPGPVVIDVDPRNGGAPSFIKCVEELGELPPSPSVLTGGGGFHFFFQSENGARSRKNLAPGIDIKANGGYVCAPFTVHPVTGKVYAWQSGMSINDIALTPLPKKWSTWIESLPPEAEAPSTPTGTGILDGTRHDSLLSLAGAMRRKGSSTAEIEAALLVANKDRCNPPMPDDEVKRIAKSMANYAPSGSVVEFPLFEDVVSRASGAPPMVEWLLDGSIARGDTSLLVGPPEIGKSWILLDLAVCCSLGIPVFGHYPVKRGRVLLIDEENPPDEAYRRLWSIVKAHEATAADLRDHLFMMEPKQGFSFRRRSRVAGLHQAIADIKPDVILIDSMVAVSSVKDEGSAREVRDFFHDDIAPLQKATKATVLIVHHTNKAVYLLDQPCTDPGLVRGSIDMVAAIDSGLMLRSGGKSRTLTLSSLKVRRGPRPEPLTLKLVDGYKGGVRPLVIKGGSIMGSTTSIAKSAIVDVLRDFGMPVDSVTIYRKVKEMHPTIDQGPLRAALQKLGASGEIQAMTEGKSTIYSLPS